MAVIPRDEVFEKNVLLQCLSLSSDQEFKRKISQMSHKDRMEFLSTNGFQPVLNPHNIATMGISVKPQDVKLK